MQLKKPIGATLASATCGLLGALPSAPVAAQEAPKWEVDTSLLYYGEDDSRVTDASLVASIRRILNEDRSFNLTLTVDSLTGATPNGAAPSSGVQTFTNASGNSAYTIAPGEQPLDTEFLDTRVALSGNWQQSLGEAMRWSAGFSASDEYDYLHLGVEGRLERDLNLKNTTVYVGAAYGKDDMNPVGGTPIGLAPMLEVDNDSNKTGDDSKDVMDVLVGVTHVLSRRSLLEVAYSYGKSDGYLSDPYKFLSVVDPLTGLPVPGPVGSGLNLYLYEHRPDARTKQSLFAEWRHAFDRDSMAINFRLMDDDWGVTSQTVDARYRWNMNADSYLEPHLRYYKQGEADFYRTVLFDGAPLPEHASADYRLADSEAFTAGVKYGHRTARGEWSVRLEYYQQTAEPSAGSVVGDLINHDLIPDLTAVIVQFGYKFSF
jgi:Protein of unknown function (DUF3570)